MLCCIAIRCTCCVCFFALRCVAIRCVAVVLFLLSCVTLCCIVAHCIVLCCVVDKFSISRIPSMLKFISRQTQPTSLTGRQSLHQRTRQTQPPLPNRQTQHLSLTLRQYEPHYATNSTNSTTLAKQPNLTILTYFKTVRTHNTTNSTKSTNCYPLRETKTSHLDTTRRNSTPNRQTQ